MCHTGALLQWSCHVLTTRRYVEWLDVTFSFARPHDAPQIVLPLLSCLATGETGLVCATVQGKVSRKSSQSREADSKQSASTSAVAAAASVDSQQLRLTYPASAEPSSSTMYADYPLYVTGTTSASTPHAAPPPLSLSVSLSLLSSL